MTVFEDTVKKYIIEHNCCNIFLYTHGYVTMSDLTDTLSCIVIINDIMAMTSFSNLNRKKMNNNILDTFCFLSKGVEFWRKYK